MGIIKKEFSKEIIPILAEVKRFMKNDLHFDYTSNHPDIICEKAYQTKDLEGDIVECGVFQGYSIFTVAQFCKLMKINKNIIGFDTFGGFLDNHIHKYDSPDYFKTLHKQNRISKDHFDKAAKRTKNFTDTSHLTKEYFFDIKQVWEISKKYPNIKLIKGVFKDTLPKYKKQISILYIDCDIYQGYKDCLELLYDQVVVGGVAIFDEYYSWKYPGARVAVDEFFANRNGHFEYYLTKEGFERWCFIKKI